ncbi:hypothetical protein CFBP4996_08295 [Agrobacterium leguminum]|uniref:Transmembrane protein n=1 Tax=Agrobacterium deltaense NCPPB 1641 TaxID=1183425 RepID=A0A1S7TJL3_9HYPH|nr:MULTISPECIES: hypothetical protein [Agrobacterium]WFS64549.1 hypothetical protein CFBP4996_08295 [Agrobacterium leguminum]CVI54740.1 conserved hypothetical protein [Agrobacterium deltaense NCPPB 1641]
MDENGLRMKSSGRVAVEQQGQVILAQIRAKTIQKLGLFCLAGVFLIGASLIVVFAPEGRETLSSFIGVGLVVAAAGSAGYGRFGVKVPGVEAAFGGADKARDNELP